MQLDEHNRDVAQDLNNWNLNRDHSRDKTISVEMNKTYIIDSTIDGHEELANSGGGVSGFDNHFKEDKLTEENEKSITNDEGKVLSEGVTTSNIRTTSFRKYFSADGDLIDDIDSEVCIIQ